MQLILSTVYSKKMEYLHNLKEKLNEETVFQFENIIYDDKSQELLDSFCSNLPSSNLNTDLNSNSNHNYFNINFIKKELSLRAIDRVYSKQCERDY